MTTESELKFECPLCGQHISATCANSGSEAPCPGCGETLTVPGLFAEPPPRPESAPSKTGQDGSPRRSKWLPVYAVAASFLIVVLLMRSVPKTTGRDDAASALAAQTLQESRRLAEALERQRTDSSNEARRISAELEKQRKANAELLERQSLAEQQRKVAAEQERKDAAAARLAEQQAQSRQSARNATLAKIEGLERQLAQARQILAQTQAAQADYTRQVKEYAMEHKLAIAALGITLGGGAIAMSDSKEFTSDQQTVAGGAAVLGGLYAITHHEECLEVANTMAKVATIQADYEKQVKDVQRQASSLQSQTNRLRSDLD